MPKAVGRLMDVSALGDALAADVPGVTNQRVETLGVTARDQSDRMSVASSFLN